jgi:hypothetical protein
MKIRDIIEGNVTHIKRVLDLATGEWKMIDMSKAKPISMMAALGDEEGAALQEAGVHLAEKPDDWEYLDDHYVITPSKMRKVEEILGRELDRVAGETLFGGVKPRGPLAQLSKEPKRGIFVIQFVQDGSKYLVNTLHANSYIRMWAKIDV